MKTIILTVALSLGTAPVIAQTSSGAHFKSAVASVVSSGALSVAFDEAGLGNATGAVNISLTADGNAVYACINGGGKHPQASNKTNTAEQLNVTRPFNVTRNGRISDSISAGPPSEGAFSCPSGQELEMACVKYVNVTLADTTNSVPATVTGSFDRTLLAIPGYCPIP